jgi:hypothetical protein
VTSDKAQAKATVGRRQFAPHDPLAGMTHTAKAARALRSRMPGRLYSYDTILKRFAQALEDMPPEPRPFIQEEHAVVRPRHGRVVTTAVRAPVRPATRWRRGVSKASARGIAGRMGMRRCAAWNA